jgi:hypothetical protein
MKENKMKSFRQYVNERMEDNDINGGLGDLSMSGTAPDDTLMRLSKLVIKSHKDSYLNFLTHLAHQDQRIKNELETYHNDTVHHHPKKKDDKDGYQGDTDEVVPSSADAASGVEPGGDD